MSSQGKGSKGSSGIPAPPSRGTGYPIPIRPPTYGQDKNTSSITAGEAPPEGTGKGPAPIPSTSGPSAPGGAKKSTLTGTGIIHSEPETYHGPIAGLPPPTKKASTAHPTKSSSGNNFPFSQDLKPKGKSEPENELHSAPANMRYTGDPKSVRGLAASGFPIVKKTTARKDTTGSTTTKGSATSRGTQAGTSATSPTSPTKPIIGVVIPHAGKEIPKDWPEQMIEQLKNFRQMMTDAYICQTRFRKWEKMAASTEAYLPAPEEELDYDDMSDFARDVAQQIYKRRIVRDYDDFVKMRMGNPETWPMYKDPRGTIPPARNVLYRLAFEDAASGSLGPLGKVRYENWNLLYDFVPYEIARLTDLEKIEVLKEEGMTEEVARVRLFKILMQEGRTREEAKNRVMHISSPGDRDVMAAMQGAHFP